MPEQISETPFSPEFLECKRLWDALGAHLDAVGHIHPGEDGYDEGERVAADLQERFNVAESALLARPPRTLQGLRERAIFWKLDDSNPSPTNLQIAVLAAIEAVVPGGLNFPE
jgi:hypothetical protein